MAIGERIHYFRNKLGMTQRFLGEKLGFASKTADVRMAQYESEVRVPKDNLINILAETFDVSPTALKVPDIDSYVGVMHTLFVLEDRYGLQIVTEDGINPCIMVKATNPDGRQMFDLLRDWLEKSEELKAGTITREEYDHWRYNFPTTDSLKGSR